MKIIKFFYGIVVRKNILITIFCIFLSSLIVVIEPCQQKILAYNGFKDINNDNAIRATNNAITHNMSGIKYLNDGYPLHAINEFKLSLMLNPNSAMSSSIYNNLGRSYEIVKQYDLAIASYEHAIKINPDFALYYKNLVNVYRIKGILPKAQLNYERIIKQNQKDSYAYFILGLIQLEQNNNAKAIESFKEFIKLEPNVALVSSAKKYLEILDPGSIKK